MQQGQGTLEARLRLGVAGRGEMHITEPFWGLATVLVGHLGRGGLDRDEHTCGEDPQSNGGTHETPPGGIPLARWNLNGGGRLRKRPQAQDRRRSVLISPSVFPTLTTRRSRARHSASRAGSSTFLPIPRSPPPPPPPREPPRQPGRQLDLPPDPRLHPLGELRRMRGGEKHTSGVG